MQTSADGPANAGDKGTGLPGPNSPRRPPDQRSRLPRSARKSIRNQEAARPAAAYRDRHRINRSHTDADPMKAKPQLIVFPASDLDSAKRCFNTTLGTE